VNDPEPAAWHAACTICGAVFTRADEGQARHQALSHVEAEHVLVDVYQGPRELKPPRPGPMQPGGRGPRAG
jgi:hypothetical protein